MTLSQGVKKTRGKAKGGEIEIREKIFMYGLKFWQVYNRSRAFSGNFNIAQNWLTISGGVP